MGAADKIIDNSFLLITKYFEGKTLTANAMRVLDILFTANIASFVLEKYYFKYHWLDITDYKGIISFFVRGGYILPIALFVCLYVVIWMGAAGVLLITMNYFFKKLIKAKFLNGIAKAAVVEHLKTKPATDLPIFVEQISKVLAILLNVFVLASKSIVLIVLYFDHNNFLKSKLFIVMLVILICIMVGVWCIRLFLSLLRQRIKKALADAGKAVAASTPPLKSGAGQH